MNKVTTISRENHDFDSILKLIDSTISPDYLNKTQEMVLREVWCGKTYAKIANDYNYDSEYIKTVGCNLWQILSNAFNEQINKGNFVPFMKRKIDYISENTNALLKDDLTQFSVEKYKKTKKCYWNTAPSTDVFTGREEEFNLLRSWSQNSECRGIMVSGMVGSGKTSLVTKFSKSIKEKYDYVIWNSLYNPPSAITLIKNYLSIISPAFTKSILDDYDSISFLISHLINLLKEKKVLLILDGLENILKTEKTILYKKEYEDYSQFIRSIISTNHKSLLICTTLVAPKNTRYYEAKRVKFMQIGGLTDTSINKIHSSNICEPHFSKIILHLYNSVDNNPKIINIINNNLDFFEENTFFESLVSEFSYFDEIIDLIEKEITYSLDIEKEIIYWLAIYDSCISIQELFSSLELCKSKIKLTKIIESLEERKIISYEKTNIYLMPIIKSYLRRKLIFQSLNT